MAQPEIVILLHSSRARTSLTETVERARADADAAKVVVLLERPADALECAKLKVDGIVVSSPQLLQLLKCLEAVRGGERWVDPSVVAPISQLRSKNQASLTSRERQIVNCVIRGLRNKEIARELNLRECTVKMHLHHIFDKLKLANRTQLALAFSEPENNGGQAPGLATAGHLSA
jgi:two-component system nitrate/nitrite response regulator NarP